MNSRFDTVDAFAIFGIDDAIFVAVMAITDQVASAAMQAAFSPDMLYFRPLPTPTEQFGTPPTRDDVLPDTFTANKWVIGALVVGGVMLGASIIAKKK